MLFDLEYYKEELEFIRDELPHLDPDSDWAKHLAEKEAEYAFEVDLLESLMTGKCLI